LVNILDEKKGENILLLDLIGVCSFTDYFVICSGTSERMLRALAYGDVILHLFSPAVRQYYQLEDLWREGRTLVHMR